MPDENASVPARRDHDNLLVPFERSRPQLPTSEIFFIFLIVKLSSKTTMKEKVDLEIHAVLKGLTVDDLPCWVRVAIWPRLHKLCH